jgi:hypothetical protein
MEAWLSKDGIPPLKHAGVGWYHVYVSVLASCWSYKIDPLLSVLIRQSNTVAQKVSDGRLFYKYINNSNNSITKKMSNVRRNG